MKIDINSELTRFGNFLCQESNTNIIFSGKFGIGKTYFIREFFEKKKTEYIYLYLAPVNYSIASNEDIFEYIKVDILLQLLEKIPCDLESIEYNLSDIVICYIRNHFDSFSRLLLDKASSIADLTDDNGLNIGFKLIQFVSSLKKNIDTFEQTQSTQDKNDIRNFFQYISKKKGSIFEYDIISQLITRLISKFKESEYSKQIVLVIDDMDRIDPEHIFRILNILSAHDNFCKNGNHKFGIDKTILICDIINIRNIYKAKYGMNVDFNGYIDKFYSKEIFHFDNTQNIINVISNILISIKSEQNDCLNNPIDITFKCCNSLLIALLNNNSINLRTLSKIIDINYTNNRVISLNGKKYNATDFVTLHVFDFLSKILGSLDDLEEYIMKLTPKDIKSKEEYIVEGFLVLADYENNQFEQKTHKYSDGITYQLCNPYFPDLMFNYNEFWMSNKNKINHSTAIDILKNAFANYKKYFCDK